MSVCSTLHAWKPAHTVCWLSSRLCVWACTQAAGLLCQALYSISHLASPTARFQRAKHNFHFICVCVCTHHMCAGACRGQKRSDPCEWGDRWLHSHCSCFLRFLYARGHLCSACCLCKAADPVNWSHHSTAASCLCPGNRRRAPWRAVAVLEPARQPQAKSILH